jgi:hypothetical protein
MYRLSATDAINPAFERMRAILLRPFRFKTWLKIGFIGLLAGAGAGGFNLNVPYLPSSGGSSGGAAGDDVERAVRAFFSAHLWLIAVMAAAGLLIVLGFVYLFCRFRFILFDSILQNDPQIGRGWRRYGREANRYFGFVVSFMVASGIALALVVGLPLWRAFKSGVFKSDNPLPALLAYLLPMLLGVFLFGIIAASIASLANDFAVPLLALDDKTIGGAWSALKEMISAEPWAFAGYLGMKVVLSIAAGIVIGIAMIIVILVLAIPAVVVVAMLAYVLKDSGAAGMTIGILLAAIGILVTTALLLILSMLASAPVAVFFTSYAFYFLGGRYPRLGALLWPQPPASVTPPLMPPPPPIPGAAPAM